MTTTTDKRRILIQLDSDPHPSVFDRVVAIDAGVDEVFAYGGVTVQDTPGLVHGAIFTRKPTDLKRTAIFVGGRDLAAGEAIMAAVRGAFVGPLRVSVMLDANGANTTAAAAVMAAGRHGPLAGARALVLGGTGPVGRRVARLLARSGATVRMAGRNFDKVAAAAGSVARVVGAAVEPVAIDHPDQLAEALTGVRVVVTAGAAGVCLLPLAARHAASQLAVAIDLNAIPPLGIEGIEVSDNGVPREGVACYGALGVGSAKMRIHRGALAHLFESHDQILDAEEILEIGRLLANGPTA